MKRVFLVGLSLGLLAAAAIAASRPEAPSKILQGQPWNGGKMRGAFAISHSGTLGGMALASGAEVDVLLRFETSCESLRTLVRGLKGATVENVNEQDHGPCVPGATVARRVRLARVGSGRALLAVDVSYRSKNGVWRRETRTLSLRDVTASPKAVTMVRNLKGVRNGERLRVFQAESPADRGLDPGTDRR